MKFRNKLISVLTLPITLVAGTPFVRQVVFSSTGAITKQTGSENASLEINVKGRIGDSYLLTTRLYINKTNTLQFSSHQDGVFSASGNSHSFNYPLRYRLTGDGLRFNYQLECGTQNIEANGVLYPYTPLNINAILYRDSGYQSENRFIKLENNKVVTGERFGFSNFNEYISKQKNNALDFSTVNFEYLENFDFIYSKAELHIKDYNDVYPQLTKTDNEIVINLACFNKKGTICFAYNDNLYVNQETLDMSSIYLPDYVEADNFYIPIGKQHLLEESDSYILVKEVGYSSIDITLPLSFYFTKKMLGLCYDSDYCIEGGILE